MWVDEFSWVMAARRYRGHYLVTRAMDEIDFRTPVPNGAILRFHILPHKRSRTSVTYRTEVYSDEEGAKEEKLVFTTHITFACVDEQGAKQELPPEE